MALSVQPVVFIPVQPIKPVSAKRTDLKPDKPRGRRGKPADGKGQLVDIDG